MSSASAKEITAPTTAWVLVAAGPKMLARRLIGSPSHSRIPSAGAYRTSQWLCGVRAAHRRAHDWIRAGTRRRWPQIVGPEALAWGRQPFDYERARLDAEQLAARLRAPCCVAGRCPL